jgi:hypothetical protein
VLAAPKPLNGDRYFLLAPLAELLEKRQPLAATVCLRAMINFTLKVARSKRYPHAARHLETCHRLAAGINDWGDWLITAVICCSCGGITTASVAFGVRCLRRLFLRLRRELKLRERVWWRKGGRVGGCRAQGQQLLKLNLSNRGYGNWRAPLMAIGSSARRLASNNNDKYLHEI